MNKRVRDILLAVLSGLLLTVSWYGGMFFVIFVALVPLFIIAEHQLRQTRPYPALFALVFVAFLTWNLGVTWWVIYAHESAVLAFVLNSLFMTMVFCLGVWLKAKQHRRYAWLLIIPVWLGWEFFHGWWKLSWTWLNLGNVFAFRPEIVQWFEFTGVAGGTAWIWLTNIMIFLAIRSEATWFRRVRGPVLGLLVPIAASYGIMTWRQSQLQFSPPPTVKMMVVQPNNDPYGEEFSADFNTQLIKIENLVRGKLNDHVQYLLLPETFISGSIDEAGINHSLPVMMMRERLLRQFPDLTIVTGASTYSVYGKEKLTSTARYDKNGDFYYDYYNTAMQVTSDTILLYHKSKLVPGVEWLPAMFGSLAIDMGGTVGSLGVQDDRSVFIGNGGRTCVGPVICYESVYPDFVSGYVKKGASVIAIITNDGWWQDTPGYRQHENYARLRAIENRRSVARCANTGISCFIDPFGNVSQATNWWQPAVIVSDVATIETRTFFSLVGDWMSYFSVVFFFVAIAWWLSLRVFAIASRQKGKKQ